MHPVARALKTLALLALLALPAAAQLANMDQSCTVRQSKQTSGSGSTIPYASNVVSGNLLAFSYHTRANVTTPTITDTLGSTWTLRTTQGTTNTWVYTWTATAAGSGADTVTITKSGGSIERFGILELGNCPEVIDATTTANVTVSSGNITLPNITTTAYRDFILWVVFSNTSGSRTDQSAYNYTWDIVSQYNATDAFTYLTDYSGEPGAFTGPTIGAAGSASVGVIAIKMASALTVSTPKLPDAVSGTAYSFQLHAKGGAGTNVWTKTAGSLPCGLSLSSSGVISGTPTCSNANTITFQVTDS
ncbi:MAG: putative Ig domain-containing protein, partial [Mycobacteriales bacterium]